MKLLLILVDGMRPDVLPKIPQAQAMLKTASYSLTARTVYPPVTLPCHISLFHSVGPERHGTTTNTYAPQVRPVPGLFEQLVNAGKHCAMFYSWEELRDVSRPGSLGAGCFYSGAVHGFEAAGQVLTGEAIRYIADHAPDLAFLYLGWPDVAGHTFGWMGEEYRRACLGSWNEIGRIVKTLPGEYLVCITADHGGHGRDHGVQVAEDMTIPVFLQGGPFAAGKDLGAVSILDLAPTIAGLLGVPCAKEWEGCDLADSGTL